MFRLRAILQIQGSYNNCFMPYAVPLEAAAPRDVDTIHVKKAIIYILMVKFLQWYNR